MDSRLIRLKDFSKTLPDKPGCYLMLNKSDEVIYVGKAKSLKKRVGSYFNASSTHSPKTEVLISHINNIDFQMTVNESEALVLENNLIKKYSPKYNIMMRDDKTYPYVVVDYNEPFPRPVYTRRFKRKKNLKVFGPFVHGSNISEVLRVIYKSFGLRDCSLREFKKRKEPCLLYQIKQCSAPCVGKIDEQAYMDDLAFALNFFSGKGKKALARLRELMMEASENEIFEKAAIVRDSLEVLESFVENSFQENAEFGPEHRNVDIVAHYQGEQEIDISLYMIREGILIGHKNFHFLNADLYEDPEEDILEYVFQYYFNTVESHPEKVITEFSSSHNEVLAESLKKIGFDSIKVLCARGKMKSIFGLTRDHAKEQQRVRIQNQESVYLGLNKLKELLNLKDRPRKIECYDIAIFSGASPTAGQVTFVDGVPFKKDYRYYHLEVRDEGNNDFAMMEETLRRRLEHGHLPDVFLVDGGKGQISVFKKVLDEAKIEIPVIGIAKSRVVNKKAVRKKGEYHSKEIERSEERLFIPGRANPFSLSKNISLYRILTRMRDEAHRFSRKLHHHGEKGRIISSWVDQVPGIGKKTREKILRKLEKSKYELQQLSVEEISDELDISLKLAENIKNH